MKKLALLALSILLIPTSLFGNKLFGYRLFEDVRDTHRADMINAETHNETSGGFNVVWINPIKPNGSFQYYNLAYDINDYSIQEVVASANMSSMEFVKLKWRLGRVGWNADLKPDLISITLVLEECRPKHITRILMNMDWT